MSKVDIAIIGGGIVGLAAAYNLTERYPDKRVLVLEKESEVGAHQTGHNSGVLHSGIYYRPGSLRALNCRTGKLAMEAFCQREGIDYDICGKVIVAVDESEIPRLKTIYERGQQNGVKCEIIDPPRLAQLEPHAAGMKAIHVPEAGIVNFRQVCRRLAEILEERGGWVVTSARVTEINHRGGEVVLKTRIGGEYVAPLVVNCAGLHSDRVATLSGQRPQSQILPFRGEFYQLKPEVQHFCRNLIYPVPNPAFPFLGVHFTRMIEGGVECGPNAVLAFAREGYRKLDINLRDLFEALTYPGFLRLSCKYWRVGLDELRRSFSKNAFTRALQRLMPEIRPDHLKPARAGVRAQAVSPDGAIIDDFLILEGDRVVNVCNAPSPAATASLNVGKLIVDKLAPRLDG